MSSSSEVNPPPPDQDTSLLRMFEDYYLEYASYVILERAIPHIEDGLKPVQRRILHALYEMEDGRYNKVANVIGHCMRYHPHGDAAIGEAMISLGSKGLLIDTQGNWGHDITGDKAAAPRYIEARLTEFAREVLFQKKITSWGRSYDGRFLEPITLPVKFPLLLFHGVEGIAVGLAAKILPHNFCEITQACIHSLKGEDFELLPDFPTGGIADASDYRKGLRGGRVKVRADIHILSAKTLVIREIPFETTTQTLIDSILVAADKGHFNIKKIENNTTSHVEILIHLKPGEQADKVRDALYAFTKCEVSLAANSCVISEGKPAFLDVHQLVHASAHKTQELLKKELMVQQAEIEEKIFFMDLERIFIVEKIYLKLEHCRSSKEMQTTLSSALKPHPSSLKREVRDEDLKRLTEIPIRRISRFDHQDLQKKLNISQKKLKEVKAHLRSLKAYTISHFQSLLAKYGSDFPRKTRITSLKTVVKAQVAASSKKLYMLREEGFIGTSLKKGEFLFECSPLDEVLCIAASGTFKVLKVGDKDYIAPHILHAALFRRADQNTTYNLIYRRGKQGPTMVKRCTIPAVNRGKIYSLTKGEQHSELLYLAITRSAEEKPPLLQVHLSSRGSNKPRKKILPLDFTKIAIRGRDSGGQILTKYRVLKITPTPQ